MMRTHASTSVAGLFGLTALMLVHALPAYAATTEEKVAAVTLRYDIEWDKIRRAGEELAGGQKSPSTIEGMIRTKIEVGTNRIEWKLHIPEFKMRTQRIRLHLPQVAMRTKRIVWDNPEFFLGTTKCGQYPEWHGPFTVKWKDIKCDLPQTKMVRREAKLDIPEFKWDDTEFKIDLPEVTMKLQEWKFDLPTVTIRDLDAEMKKAKERSGEIERRASDIQARQVAEVNAVVADDLREKRQEVAISFDDGISKLEKAISDVKGYGIDPANVKGENGEFYNLISLLEKLKQQKSVEIAKLEVEIAKFGSKII